MYRTPYLADYDEYFACVKGGHTISLGVDSSYGNSDTFLEHFRLAPPYVAWAVSSHGSEDTTSFVIETVDLRTARRLHEHPNGADNSFIGSMGTGPTTALVLTHTAGLAWIAHHEGPQPTNYEVWRSDRRGTTQLDAGPDVDPRSLRLHGHQISWTRAGQTRGATVE